MFSKIAKLKAHEQTFFAIIIATGVIAVWRGFWGLMDLYLFPHDATTSFIASILIGLAILGITHYTVKELM
jgi:hypothetical protein